jgi:myo-inositol-1(or 4)-monophosphatase
MPISARYMAAKHLARRAGELAHELFVNHHSLVIERKTAQHSVTHGDRAIAALVTSKLAAAFPGDAFVAERRDFPAEGGDRVWVVEAISGTLNFLRGVPYYGVSIAYAEQGRCEVGVVFDPERDELFHARRGLGAWCEHAGNESRLEIATCAALDRALICVGLDEWQPDPACLAVRHELIDAGASARIMGAPVLELAHVAAGRFDGFVGLHLDPLDLMAGLLLVDEAGGYASHVPAAGGIRVDLPSVGCATGIARALNEINGSWMASYGEDTLPETVSPGRHRRG